jgi:hypothetical protein
VYFDLPNGPFLRWALLPVLPIAAAVTITAVLATRWGRTPARGWHGWLNFPAGSVLCAAAGMLLVQVSMTAKAYPSQALLIGLAGRGGALLLGLGAALAALAVVASPRYRMILAAPLAVFTAAIVSWPATGMLGGMYVAAATLWWLQRVWDLVRQPGRPPPAHHVEAWAATARRLSLARWDAVSAIRSTRVVAQCATAGVDTVSPIQRPGSMWEADAPAHASPPTSHAPPARPRRPARRRGAVALSHRAILTPQIFRDEAEDRRQDNHQSSNTADNRAALSRSYRQS